MYQNNFSNIFDYLKLSKQPKIAELLSKQEKIILSMEIQKINEEGKCQKRIFLLTNNSVINLLKKQNLIQSFMKKMFSSENLYIIKRRINLENIYGVTLGVEKNSTKFILHVIGEHDYLFRTTQKKMNLLQALIKSYRNSTSKQISIYLKNEMVLINYCTFKSHIKAKKQVKPTQNFCHFSTSYFLTYEFQEHQNYHLQYSYNFSPLKINRFKRKQFNQIEENSKYYVLRIQQKKNDEFNKIFDFKYKFLCPSYCFSRHNQFFIFTPYIAGGSFIHFVQNRIPLKMYEAVFYIAQLIIFIEKISNQNKIYVNLDLSHFLIKQNGYLILNSFNSYFKTFQQGNLLFDISGRLNYNPPEVIFCSGFGQEICIWKLGICSYYFLKGKYPFQKANIKELYEQILDKNLNQQGIPIFIQKMLEKDKTKRIKLAQLKNLPQFKEINWQSLQRQLIKPPFVPIPYMWKNKIYALYELINLA